MRFRAIGAGAALLALAACEGGGDAGKGANSATNSAAAAPAKNISAAQKQVTGLPEGQRNGVLFRAIRDAKQDCQNVVSATLNPTSNNVPVYVATCEDDATYAVAIADDGTATVQPIMPGRGSQ